jgi:hypothetical protein
LRPSLAQVRSGPDEQRPSQLAFEEYREKIVEKIGEKRERTARDEIAQEQIRQNPPNNSQIFITDNGTQLCYEAFTGRYFLSDMETLRQAMNDVNATILHDGEACLSDFYVLVGLPMTTQSDLVGWNTDKLLELHFTAALTTDNRPCISMNYRVAPV